MNLKKTSQPQTSQPNGAVYFMGAGDAKPRFSPHEVILASTPGYFDSHGEAEITFRTHEPGQIDLSRLTVFAPSPMPDGPLSIEDSLTITSILLFNSENRVRGLHEVEAPAGVFSVQRFQTSIDLGRLELQPSDTVQITFLRHRSVELPPLVGMLVPFRAHAAASSHNDYHHLREPHTYLASNRVQAPPGESLSLILAFEETGVVDMGSLQLAVSRRTAANLMPADALDAVLVESIRMPCGQELILGSSEIWSDSHPGRLAIPARLFSHVDRWGHWVHLGPWRVLRGQQIILSLRHADQRFTEGATMTTLSAGVRFYSTLDSGGKEERIEASKFFDF